MTTARIGIIGGSGLYDFPLDDVREEMISTPWGAPSDALRIGRFEQTEVVFLPRHGRGHVFSPSGINYRANIAAMKSVGVTDIVSLSACGSFKAELYPGLFVLVDQFIDRTFARDSSFFGNGCVAHVSLAHPVSPNLVRRLNEAAQAMEITVHSGGTYVGIEGPHFSTLAESLQFKAAGFDVIGMTACTEAKLAREAEISYACVAMVTDFDCWHASHDIVDVAAVVAVMQRNAGQAHRLIGAFLRDFPAEHEPCAIGSDRALETAIMTAPAQRDADLGTLMNLKDAIRTIPDYPKAGIMFRDITTLLGDAQAFRQAIDQLVQPWAGTKIDKVAGMEARGFILGGAVAHQLSAGFVPIRKKGKLPHTTVRIAYSLEYGLDEMEMHQDAVKPGERVILVDDLIATGGTAEGACKLLKQIGADVVAACFVIDLPDLGGAQKIRDMGVPVRSLIEFSGH
eukprot:gene7316-7386_t